MDSAIVHKGMRLVHQLLTFGEQFAMTLASAYATIYLPISIGRSGIGQIILLLYISLCICQPLFYVKCT